MSSSKIASIIILFTVRFLPFKVTSAVDASLLTSYTTLISSVATPRQLTCLSLVFMRLKPSYNILKNKEYTVESLNMRVTASLRERIRLEISCDMLGTANSMDLINVQSQQVGDRHPCARI